MRVCDKCGKSPTQEVQLILEDEWFDLCEKHMQELSEFLRKKDKRRGLFKK